MAKAKEALEQWLEGLEKQGKLETEALEAVRSALSPDKLPAEAVEYIGGSVLRQEDYSKVIQAAKTKEQEAAAYQQELANWKGTAEAEYFEMQRKLSEAEQEAAALRATAREYVPEAELDKLERKPVVKDPKEVVPQIDTSEFLKKQEAQEAMMNALKVQNRLMFIGAQHQKLFGTPLEDAELIDRAVTAGRTLDEEWEDRYKVADKKAELAKAEQEAHDQKIREEERSRVLSELKLPEQRSGAPTSPVLNEFYKPKQDVNDSKSGVQAALEAYSAGTYRPKQTA